MFVDRIRLRVRAGDGGKGAISFRREAHVPRGGPDGGDGGRGGDVIVRVDPGSTTLGDHRFTKRVAAEHGGAGARRDRTGRSGADAVLRVPPGTLIREVESGQTVADLVAPRQEVVVTRGGRGGRGNARFASSSRRAPRIAEDGQPGEERELELELKLLADVGLVGLPNAGKSSLLAALTRAKPKIAAYPFTTLSPNLGVLRLDDRELVVADIPGLIEGAHAGAGLGEDFLRHIERTRLLVHVLDASLPDPLADRATVEAELRAFGGALESLPRIVALNKVDLPEAAAMAEDLSTRLAPQVALAVSALTGAGVQELARGVLAACPPRPQVEPAAPTERRIAFTRSGRDWNVVREDGGFRINGDRVERVAAGMDWASPDAAAYFQQLLERSGIDRELRTLGIREGDTVRIGKLELEWHEAI